MNKILAHQKIRRPKPCLLMFASLVVLDGFHLLLSTQLTADFTQEWSSGSMFHPLSRIYANSPFCLIETVANNALNRRRVVVFDQLWANAAPTLNTAFSLTNVYAKWWIHYLLTSSTPLQAYATLRSAKTSLWRFFVCVFSGTTAEFGWPERSASFVPVQQCLKSAYHLLTVVSDVAESE